MNVSLSYLCTVIQSRQKVLKIVLKSRSDARRCTTDESSHHALAPNTEHRSAPLVSRRERETRQQTTLGHYYMCILDVSSQLCLDFAYDFVPCCLVAKKISRYLPDLYLFASFSNSVPSEVSPDMLKWIMS